MADVLTNEFYKQFNSVNRYAQYPCYYNSLDKRYMGGITGWLNDNTPFTYHTIQPGDTLDSLALYYYSNATKYWIIADYNRIIDPYAKLEVGSKIKIPSYADIEFL